MKLLRVLQYAVPGYNFLKFAEISVAILDERLVLLFILLSNIYETKPDIFEIFQNFFETFRKTIGKFRKHIQAIFVIFVSRPNYRTGCRSVTHCQQEQCYSGIRSPGRSTQPTFEYFHNKVSFYEDIVQLFLALKITLLYS